MSKRDEELTPKEKIIQNEGDAMSNALRGSTSSPLVGPDGQPLEKALAPPGEDGVDPAEEARRRQVAERVQMVEEAQKLLLELSAKDEVLTNCMAVMLVAHRLIYWAKIEMASREDVTDLLMDFAERFQRAKAYGERPEGYWLSNMRGSVLDHVVPFLTERIQYYSDARRVRDMRLKKVYKKMGGRKTLSLPLHVQYKFERGFRPGDVLVVHGPNAKTAVQKCGKEHRMHDRGRVYCLSLKDAHEENDYADVLMPAGWWKNAAASLNKLDETLNPVADDECALLIIERLDDLMLDSEKHKAPMERKVMALTRVYAWARENSVAVIAADFLPPGVDAGRIYQAVPYVTDAEVLKGD